MEDKELRRIARERVEFKRHRNRARRPPALAGGGIALPP